MASRLVLGAPINERAVATEVHRLHGKPGIFLVDCAKGVTKSLAATRNLDQAYPHGMLNDSRASSPADLQGGSRNELDPQERFVTQQSVMRAPVIVAAICPRTRHATRHANRTSMGAWQAISKAATL